jgi:diguanylate cyclase (GGDEF)-like protein
MMPRSYRIDPLYAEFEDPEVEQGFREYIRDIRVRDTRLAVGIGAMFYIAFAVTDFLNVGAGWAYTQILLTRMGVALLGLAAALLARRYWIWLVNGVAPTIIVTCASLGLLSITLHRPFEIGWHGMSMMLMLLGTYVFIPNRFMPAVVVALLASLAFLWLMLLSLHPGPDTVITLITLLVVMNILGAMTAYRISRMQHESYIDAAVLKGANEALQKEMTQREGLEDELRELLERDPLTGLPNRANFFPYAEELIERAEEHGEALSFMVIDIDYFRQINGTYGHHRADEVLQVLAGCCRSQLTAGRRSARLGGDDFAIILPGADLTAAQQCAEALRVEIGRAEVDLGDSALQFTVSIGVAQRHPKETINSLLRRADQALLAAKYNGRNRVEDAPMASAMAGGIEWS